MGRVTRRLPVQAIAGVPRGSSQQVNEAVQQALSEAAAVLGDWASTMQGWLERDIVSARYMDDTSASIEVCVRGADAPGSLVAHWTDLLVTLTRPEIERALAPAGIEPAPAWPSAIAHDKTALFVEVDGQIGTVVDGHVHWCYPVVVDETVSVEDLPEDQRTRIEAGACACGPCCEYIAVAPTLLLASATIERIYVGRRVALHLSRHALFIKDSGWVGRRTTDGVTSHFRGHELTALIDSSAGLVALCDAATLTSGSADRGVTWSALVPTDLPELPAPVVFASGDDAEVVWIVPRPPTQLWRSEDGGRSFRATRAAFASPRIEYVRDIVEVGNRILVDVRTRQGAVIEHSDDGGVSWTAFPQVRNSALRGHACGQIAVTTMRAGATSLWFSSDGGRTWSDERELTNDVHVLDGSRWYRVDVFAGGKLSYSDDDGDSWIEMLVCNSPNVWPDPADPCAVYVLTHGSVFRVVGPPRPDRPPTVFASSPGSTPFAAVRGRKKR